MACFNPKKWIRWILVWVGQLYYQDLITLKENESKETDYNHNFNMIVVIKDSKVFITNDEIGKYIDAIKEN